MSVAPHMSPAAANGLAATVTELVHEGQTTTLRFMAGQLARGIDSVGWLPGQYEASAMVYRRTDQIVSRLAGQVEREIASALGEAYRRGHGSGPGAGVAQGLIGRLRSSLPPVWAMWRQAVRAAWSRILARGSGQPSGPARRAVVQWELDQLAARGITGFRDSRGRPWSAPGYVRQAVAHQAGQAAMDGWFAALAETGHLLVIVPETPTTCPLCAPWLGKVLAILPDGEYPTVAQARLAGLWHPNCQHAAESWFPGYRYQPVPFQIRRTREVLYEAAQRERAIERTLRQWRDREAAALNDMARARAARKVKQWTAVLKTHRREHGSTPRRAA